MILNVDNFIDQKIPSDVFNKKIIIDFSTA